jgi:hypothetical protein
MYIWMLLLLYLTALSCNKPGCAQTSGSVVKKERAVPPFQHLIVLDNINVVLRQDSVCKVFVETDEALQPVIIARVTDGQLVLENKASCSWIRRPGESITVYVQVPNLSKIDYQGSGNIVCTDTLRFENFFIEADHGAGNINLLLRTKFTKVFINNEVTYINIAGGSDSCYAWCASRGTIDLRAFEVQRMALSYASVRPGYIWATQSLRATLFNEGDLFYKGAPEIQADYRSSGRLLPLR